MVKAAIAAMKGLVALIAAGGWVVVIVIIVICLIGLLVGSIFGIFFSGEDSGNGYTMPMTITEINQEYADKMAEQYDFTDKQKAQLAELLSDQYADLCRQFYTSSITAAAILPPWRFHKSAT